MCWYIETSIYVGRVMLLAITSEASACMCFLLCSVRHYISFHIFYQEFIKLLIANSFTERQQFHFIKKAGESEQAAMYMYIIKIVLILYKFREYNF